MNTLQDLLDKSSEEDTVFVSHPILQEACEALALKRRKRAVQACQGLVESFTTNMKKNVILLRKMRKDAKRQTEKVKNLNRTVQYFAETGNPLPVFNAQGRMSYGLEWCVQAQIEAPELDDPSWDVPKDWEPEKSTVIDDDEK